MPKIMLVEDDNNLREIYGERLMAEGYEIVSAADGEQALSLAVKEKPDLVISDVMMPKISGFDMLDILRQTPETQDIRVVMMTALSQTEDKERAEKLGIDKYLVKSQVTLEDVARVVHDILYPTPPASQQTNEPPVIVNQPVVEEVSVVEEPVINPQPLQDNITEAIVVDPTPQPSETITPVQPTSITSITDDTSNDADDSSDQTAVQPIVSTVADDIPATPSDADIADLNNIVNQVLSDQPETVQEVVVEESVPVAPELEIIDPEDAKPETTEQEEAEVNRQIDDFVNNTPREDLDNNQQKPFIEPSEQTNSNPEQSPTEPETDATNPADITTQPEADPSTIPSISSHNTGSNTQSESSVPEAPSARKKVISPIHDPTEEKPDINQLFEQEMADEATNLAVENQNLVNTNTELPPPVPSQPLQTIDVNQIEGASTAPEPQFDENAVPSPAPPDEQSTDSTPNNPNDPTHIAL